MIKSAILNGLRAVVILTGFVLVAFLCVLPILLALNYNNYWYLFLYVLYFFIMGVTAYIREMN